MDAISWHDQGALSWAIQSLKGEGPLKLFTVYSPPAEDEGVSHKTKQEAEAEED